MPKPKEIAELEKALGVRLKRMRKIEDLEDNYTSYVLNKEGEVIGINLYGDDKAIGKDASFIGNLSALEYLNLNYVHLSQYEFINHLKKLKILTLSGNDLPNIDFLSELPELYYISLYNNKISIINGLERFGNLTELSLGANRISDIEFLRAAPQLRLLSLPHNKISDISMLQDHVHLEHLYLNENPVKDIAVIRNFKRLRELLLNKVSCADYSLGDLRELKMLSLAGNDISDLSFLRNLNELTFLNISGNSIADLSCLRHLKDLEILHLGNNKISNIDDLIGFNNLESLYLPDNQITDCRPLHALPQLANIDLTNNQISDVSSLLPLIKRGMTIQLERRGMGSAINLYGNPLPESLVAVIRKGIDALIRHLERMESEGIDYIHEAKLTLVGEGSSGKTSLQTRLLDEKAELPKEETRTRGIQIHDWKFKEDGKEHTVHVWDFGGQDVYYPVHRFFLTEKSVFVLLATTRHKEHNFGYWIPTIFQFGGNSPIILGQTCHDGSKAAWTDISYYLSNNDFNIVKTSKLPYYELNLPHHNEGLAAIREVIIQQVTGLTHYGKGVPRSWVPARQAVLEESKQHACISFERLEQLCRGTNPEKFLSATDVEDFASFLHSMGIILWYSENEELKNWVILQPEWAMNAVYKIIDDGAIQDRRGIILAADLKRIWNEPSYRRRHPILKKMLQIFKIAFPKKNKIEDHIMPTRLLSMPKESAWPEGEPCLRLIYEYEFMPKGLVNQLSAELSGLILSDGDVWNNAVHFNYEDRALAQVTEDFYNRKITIKAKGKDARGLLMMIMHAMKGITDGYRGVTPKVIVPCSCTKCQVSVRPTIFAYDDLLRWSNEKDGVHCNESDQRILIRDLLFNAGFEQPDQRDRLPEENGAIRQLRAFMSYSRFDGESNRDGVNYLEEFKEHLAPLTEPYDGPIQAWDDTLLLAGEDWDNRISEELERADVIFLLISKHFLNTKYIREKELATAIKRYEKGECVVVPIIVGACGWQEVPMLKKLNALPRKGHVIASWKNNKDWATKDDAWMHVYREVRKLLPG